MIYFKKERKKNKAEVSGGSTSGVPVALRWFSVFNLFWLCCFQTAKSCCAAPHNTTMFPQQDLSRQKQYGIQSRKQTCHTLSFSLCQYLHPFGLQRSRPVCAETGDFVQLLGGSGIDTSKLLPITDLCVSFTGPSKFTPLADLPRRPPRCEWWKQPLLQLTWRSAATTRWWGWCPAGSSSAGCRSATGYWTVRSCRPSNSTTWRISASTTDASTTTTCFIWLSSFLFLKIKLFDLTWESPLIIIHCNVHIN